MVNIMLYVIIGNYLDGWLIRQISRFNISVTAFR